MVGCRVLISMASRILCLNQPSSLANTSTLFLLMTWPCSRQWSPTAVGWVLWLVWSFILVARVLPVSPTYKCWHCGHVTWYTTPHFCRSGVLSLGCTNKERMVFMGRWYTPTSCARKGRDSTCPRSTAKFYLSVSHVIAVVRRAVTQPRRSGQLPVAARRRRRDVFESLRLQAKKRLLKGNNFSTITMTESDNNIHAVSKLG